MDFCPRYSMVAFTHVDRSNALFTRLRCGMWSCPYCAKKNQAIWRAFLYDKLPQVSDNWWFLTVTAHAHMRKQIDSYNNLKIGIDRLMKRINRVWKDVEYVRVYEEHPTSEALHAHFVVSNLTPFVALQHNRNKTTTFTPATIRYAHKGFWSVGSYVKYAAQGVQIGYQAQVEQVANSYTVQYVTKYLTKEAQAINVKGLRAVQTSRGIGSPKVKSEYQWHIRSMVTARDFVAGMTVFDVNTGTDIPQDYFESFDYYPPETN